MQLELGVICDDALDGIHQTSCQMCGGVSINHGKVIVRYLSVVGLPVMLMLY